MLKLTYQYTGRFPLPPQLLNWTSDSRQFYERLHICVSSSALHFQILLELSDIHHLILVTCYLMYLSVPELPLNPSISDIASSLLPDKSWSDNAVTILRRNGKHDISAGKFILESKDRVQFDRIGMTIVYTLSCEPAYQTKNKISFEMIPLQKKWKTKVYRYIFIRVRYRIK